MQHIVKKSPKRINSDGLLEILIFSVTRPGWTLAHRFTEFGFPSKSQGQCAHGCKIYENPENVRVIFHNSNYGCIL